MSTLSSIQRVFNDIILTEQNSNHKVVPENYFVVRVEILKDDIDMTEFAKKDLVAKKILRTSVLCGYVYKNVYTVLFSSTEDNHYLDGSHHELCSHYASNAAIFTKSQARCTITELESRTKVLIYFQTKIFENMKTSIIKLSNISIDKKDTSNLTQKELIEMLEKKASINWEDISCSEKYGTFYKYVLLQDGTKKFSLLTEYLDMKNIEKYNTYIFT